MLRTSTLKHFLWGDYSTNYITVRIYLYNKSGKTILLYTLYSITTVFERAFVNLQKNYIHEL